jgi:hypothetical protein
LGVPGFVEPEFVEPGFVEPGFVEPFGAVFGFEGDSGVPFGLVLPFGLFGFVVPG